MIAGTSNAKLGSFTLSSSATEGVNVNTILINLATEEAATITDMRLVDNATGVQIGTTKPTLSTANTFSVNFDLPVSGTKTIDIVGNIKSGSNIGPWDAIVDTTTGGTGLTTGNSITVGSNVTLQTITIGTGTFTSAVGAANPDSLNVVAGTSDVHAGSFTFTTQNSSFKVQEMKVLVPSDAATSVASVKVRYKNSAGATEEKTAALSFTSTSAHATATFTGLDFFIPADDSGDVDVLVNVPTLSSGASTGKTISVLLDNGLESGFRAVDGSGTATTTLDGADLDGSATAGSGDFIVRGSSPTLSATPVTDQLSEGADQVIARFTVNANSGGSIGWRKIAFSINKTAAITLGATSTATIYRMPANVSVTGRFATTTGDLVAQTQMYTVAATSGNLIFEADSEQQITAGGSQQYEIRTTIGGVSTSGSNNVSVRIVAGSNTSAATSTTFANMNVTHGSATNTFVWTDRSATSHSATTADWTNDYLVKTIPLTVGNRSLTI